MDQRRNQHDRGGARILLDATMVQGGGGYTFAFHSIPRLARLSPDKHFRVLVRNPRLAEALPRLPNLEVEILPPASIADRLRFNFFEAPRIAREWAADLWFSYSEVAPIIRDCPVVAAFQNPNVFASTREHVPYQRLRLFLLKSLARLAARSCDQVVFVSEDSAQWIGDSIGLSPAKRFSIQHGIDVSEWQDSHPIDIHGRPYILSVSSIYHYKNFVRLIEAYAELAGRHDDVPDLVIIGDNQCQVHLDQMRAARDATGDLAESIHILGEVPYAEIKHYYAGASMFVFPSYLETFGIPMLEAMASDLPLVASDIPVFREIAGDAAFFADPHDTAALAEAIEEALFRPGAAHALVKRARERVKHFTWERTVGRMLRCLDEALRDQSQTEASSLPSSAPSPARAQGLIAHTGLREKAKF